MDIVVLPCISDRGPLNRRSVSVSTSGRFIQNQNLRIGQYSGQWTAAAVLRRTAVGRRRRLRYRRSHRQPADKAVRAGRHGSTHNLLPRGIRLCISNIFRNCAHKNIRFLTDHGNRPAQRSKRDRGLWPSRKNFTVASYRRLIRLTSVDFPAPEASDDASISQL